MSALAEASFLVQAIGSGAGTVKEQRRKAWVRLASLSTDFTWNRICDLHRGERRARVSGDELNALRLAAKQQKQEAEENAGRKELKELAELRERIARLEGIFRTIDPDFHSENMDALHQMAGSDAVPVHREDSSLA